MSVRLIMPPCASEYTSHGRSMSGTVQNPSPPDTVYQSAFVTLPERPMLGPHQLPLSCRPPQMRNGTLLSTSTS